MTRTIGWLAAAAIVSALTLPVAPAQAESKSTTAIEKTTPTEVSSKHRRWHRNAHRYPYRHYGYRHYRPHYYSYYRPYPYYYRAPFYFGFGW